MQLLEVGDAGRDVVQRAAVGQGRGEDGREGRAGLGRVAVDGDLVLTSGLSRSGERGRRGLDLGRVVADGHVAAVVGEPGAVRALRRPGCCSGRDLVRGQEALLGVLTANVVPMSRTSGARAWPLSWSTALSSSWLEPSGFASLILMPYLAVKSFMIAP